LTSVMPCFLTVLCSCCWLASFFWLCADRMSLFFLRSL
jgi:hypothetical protein